jgi:hypothetical protein
MSATKSDPAVETAAQRLDAFVERTQQQPPPPPSSGPTPLLVIAAAFALGLIVAKVIDWRGHAHPRR